MSWTAIALPLTAAVVYTLGALALKRALDEGAGVLRGLFVSNLMYAVLLGPLWWFDDSPTPELRLWLGTCVSMVVGFGGQVLTFAALRLGAVSVSTPVMGTKVIFVGLLSALLLGRPPDANQWIAAAIAGVAVSLLAWSPGEPAGKERRLGLGLLLGLGSAACYAASDVLASKFAGPFGILRYVGFLSVTLGLLSFVLVPFFRGPVRAISASSMAWLSLSVVLIGLQWGLLIWTFAKDGDVVLANILYTSRGLWSVVLVWLIGHWFANHERKAGTRALLVRLAGSLLILVAIAIALVPR